MTETELGRRIQLALVSYGVMVFRNSTGAYKVGDRYIRFGLAVGSSDYIGFQLKTGKFVAIEIKTARGVVTIEQQAFIDAVNKAGGIGFVARSVEEAIANFKT